MWRTIDLVLRLLYLVVAPLFLPVLASVLPITGTLVGAGVAMIVALIGGDRWHATVDRVPVLGRALGGMAKLGDFYRDHPAKPLIFYILYPLLLPVILMKPLLRKELGLYRKINAIALVVIVITGAIDYLHNWRPELGFGQFAGSMLAGFIAQFFATFALAMPIVTTIVTLRLRGQRRLLNTAIAMIVVAGTLGGVIAHHTKYVIQASTWQRIELRSKTGREELRSCTVRTQQVAQCTRENHWVLALVEGLDAAARSLKDHPNDHDAATAAAHEKLATYFKPDEVRAFDLFVESPVIIEFARNGKRKTIWIGFDYAKKQILFNNPELLSPAARKALALH
ncbi:MAG: hypothetical protein ABI678_04460 [Kofleriaceae bacterium]